MFSEPATNIVKLGISEGMKIADMGAGSGFYSIEAAKRTGVSGHVYAVDVQKSLLERLHSVARSQGIKNIEVIWGNVEKVGGTKLKDASLDRVIVSNILFQMTTPDEFALEVKRILKPDGKIMVIDWSETSAMGPKTPFVAKKAQALFEKNGFKLEQTFEAGDHHYGLILARNK